MESAKDIQNKFDKKGKDIHNRLLDIIRREENIVQVYTDISMVIHLTNTRENYNFRKKPNWLKKRKCFINNGKN